MPKSGDIVAFKLAKPDPTWKKARVSIPAYLVAVLATGDEAVALVNQWEKDPGLVSLVVPDHPEPVVLPVGAALGPTVLPVDQGVDSEGRQYTIATPPADPSRRLLALGSRDVRLLEAAVVATLKAGLGP